jgi:hypothetical protein
MAIDEGYHGYPDGTPMPADTDGIDFLRKRRGREQVTFDDVADHLNDYVRLHPSSFKALDAFAKYLAEIERAEHDPDEAGAGRTAATGGPPESSH